MRRFIGFFKKEIISLIRDPVLLVAVMVMPAVQLVVLSGAITFEANNLRLAIDTNTTDTFMEKIYNHAIGSGWFVRAPDTNADPVSAVQSGHADVAIIAPESGLTHDVMRGDGEIQVLIDATNILKAQSIEAYLQGIIAIAADEMNMTPDALPIRFDVRVLFNPRLNTKWFMVPSMIAILVFLSILILITISITKEKETGTIETLISAPISKYEIIIGKTVPYLAVAFLIMLSILLIGLFVFHIPFAGSGAMFLICFLAFCVPASGIGVLLSDFTHTQQQALLGVVIVAFMALMLSGALVPTENMPRLLQYISHANPLSHYAYSVRNLMLKGASWKYFARHCMAMLGAGVVIWFCAIRWFKTKL